MSESASAPTAFDSDREHLGMVYAQAFLKAAENQLTIAAALAELDSLIEDVLDRLPDFEQLLISPRIAAEEKQRMLDRAFGKSMSPLLLSFLKVVARRGRLDCLRHIRAAAHTLYHELQGRIAVTVETATAAGPQARSEIERRLTAAFTRPLELSYRVDPGLLGGLIVRVGDTVYDGSLRRQLETMQHDALHHTAQAIRDALPRFVAADSR